MPKRAHSHIFVDGMVEKIIFEANKFISTVKKEEVNNINMKNIAPDPSTPGLTRDQSNVQMCSFHINSATGRFVTFVLHVMRRFALCPYAFQLPVRHSTLQNRLANG